MFLFLSLTLSLFLIFPYSVDVFHSVDVLYKLWEVHVEQFHFPSNFIKINAIFTLTEPVLSHFHCLLFMISFLGRSVSIFGVSFSVYLWLLFRYQQFFLQFYVVVDCYLFVSHTCMSHEPCSMGVLWFCRWNTFPFSI